MLQSATFTREEKDTNSNKDINHLYYPPEEELNNITRLASYVCKTPESEISLVLESRQWIKSQAGIEIKDCGDSPFCNYAIQEPGKLMEVKDTREDDRFKNNSSITGTRQPIIFYAGVPLLDTHGKPMGMLSVIDHKANKLDDEQKTALRSLAKQVEILFQLLRKNYSLQHMKKELDEHNSLLKNFAGGVSHDMKMPLANIILTADILKAKYNNKLGEEGNNYLNHLKKTSLRLSNYINGVLDYYESHSIAISKSETFDLNGLLEETIDLLDITEDCTINLPEKNNVLTANRSALEQIFLNLLSNSIKYNNKEKIIVDFDCDEDELFYYFTIKDNGIGIPKEKQEEIFKLFRTLSVADRKGNKGTGIGLSTVKKLVESLGGIIQVKSEIEKGTTFRISIKRNFST